MPKPTNYTIRLMRSSKSSDDCVAEIDVDSVTATKAETIKHYAQFCRVFMRHIRFDYISLVERTNV